MKSASLCLSLCILFVVQVSVFSIDPTEEAYASDEDVLFYQPMTCYRNKTDDVPLTKVDMHFYGFDVHVNFTHQIQNPEPKDMARLASRVIRSYRLDVTRKLIFFVPDYNSNPNSDTEKLFGQTFSDRSDVYLIMIDHSVYTSGASGYGGNVKTYERAAYYARYIGKWLGEFLAGFQRGGFLSKTIHGVGHGLGAHILGFAATTYTEFTSEKFSRITGLDPAGPCFSYGPIEDQLRKGVAEYVEVYHCNAGGLGTSRVHADANFFINGGKFQPVCQQNKTWSEQDVGECSHKKCVEYWGKAEQSPSYMVWACGSYEDFLEERCLANQISKVGYGLNPGNGSGVFYLTTIPSEIDQAL